MSNLIYNGDFGLPVITTNSYLYTDTFTTIQKNAFYWTSPNTFYPALLNGTTAFGITPPTSVNATQYLVIQNDKSLSQSFTATQLGFHTISFNYAARGGYTFNNLKIYLNGTLFDTVTTTPTNWSTYSNTNLSPILGTNTLLLLGTATQNEGDIALTNIKVFYGQTGGAGVATTIAYNSFKTTNIYGGLTVYDYVNTATPPVTIPGIITTKQTYNYSYATLPAFQPSSLGCIYSSVSTASTVTANSFTNTNTGGATLPIGIYIVDSFCLFTPTAAAVHTLKLGINTISGSFTGALVSYNNTVDNTLVASASQHSIQYRNILTITATTTFYFIFNTNIAGSITLGSFNGKFIRIA